MTPAELKGHSLVTKVYQRSNETLRSLKARGLEPDSDRINEHEFYLFRVSYCLAHLLAWAEQLADAPIYLADFNYTGKAKKNGITRARYLLYTIENYLIRLQSIYDRCLQLTNCVFHLCIDEANVGHTQIVSNLHVAQTDVVSLLKAVRKAVKGKEQDRHTIIHRASYKEQDTDRLQMFYMHDKATWELVDSGATFEMLAAVRSRLLRKVVAGKRKEFQEINEDLMVALHGLLTGLESHYDRRSKKILAALGK